jgi:Cytochrome c oxidase subunit IV
MKIEYKLFVILAIFFVPVGLAYGVFSNWEEPVGSVGLFLAAGLAAMIAFYLRVTGRRLPERPEDNPGGEIAEQEGDYGFFSPHSWWPLPLAAAGALCFLGLAVGWWLFIMGAALGVVALVGWTFEYFKGPHAV